MKTKRESRLSNRFKLGSPSIIESIGTFFDYGSSVEDYPAIRNIVQKTTHQKWVESMTYIAQDFNNSIQKVVGKLIE